MILDIATSQQHKFLVDRRWVQDKKHPDIWHKNGNYFSFEEVISREIREVALAEDWFELNIWIFDSTYVDSFFENGMYSFYVNYDYPLILQTHELENWMVGGKKHTLKYYCDDLTLEVNRILDIYRISKNDMIVLRTIDDLIYEPDSDDAMRLSKRT